MIGDEVLRTLIYLCGFLERCLFETLLTLDAEPVSCKDCRPHRQ